MAPACLDRCVHELCGPMRTVCAANWPTIKLTRTVDIVIRSAYTVYTLKQTEYVMCKQVALTESELEDIYYEGSFWKPCCDGYGPDVFDHVAYGLAVVQRQCLRTAQQQWQQEQ